MVLDRSNELTASTDSAKLWLWS